jgi:hypothetical protein
LGFFALGEKVLGSNCAGTYGFVFGYTHVYNQKSFVMANTTRLSDLPTSHENISYHVQTPPSTISFPNPPDNLANTRIPTEYSTKNDGLTNSLQGTQSNYMPINVHPNPYGNSVPSVDSIPFPKNENKSESQQPHHHQHHHQHHQHHQHQPPTFNEEPPNNHILPEILPTEIHRLPSRDIPKETIHYQQDAAIQANYIPPPDPKKRVVDYIQEYDENESAKIRKNAKNKQKHEWYESLFRTYQTPIIIALLYFIFQMNIVSSFLFHYLGKWTWIYQTDGHMTLYGNILKSILFSLCYFLFVSLVTWV